MAMATTRMNGPKGPKLPPQMYGPLGPLALNPSKTVKRPKPPGTNLGPFSISAPVRDKGAKRANICGGTLYLRWPPCCSPLLPL